MHKKVCVVGLGYIGLPTACVLVNSGYKVIGVDIDEKVLSHIESKDIITPEPDLKNLLVKAFQTGNFKTSLTVSAADIFIITVPTPLSSNNLPILSHVFAVIDEIIPYLKPRNLILIESTCPIGTTNKIAQKLINICSDLYIAYCPERVLPSNIIYELINNDRVVGGIDEASTSEAVKFYQSFVQGNVYSTNAKTAEAVKLAENAYRDVNIAYANELSMIADHLNFDVKEVINLANKHPRVKILKPGPGVGGHCIAVDPWFLISSATEIALLTSQARKVNIIKTDWVIQKIRKIIKEYNIKVIACFGLTYKPNVTDIRESPALTIVQILEKEVEVLRVDPYVSNTIELYEAISRADLIVGLVAHTRFKDIHANYLNGKHLVDFAEVFT